MKSSHYFLFSLLFVFSNCYAQNTVGLLNYQPGKFFEGYNLFFPHNQSTTYLMDNCGNIVHTWDLPDTLRPGNSVYLLEDGNLLRCSRPNNITNDPIWAGGGGQFVDIVDWDGNVLNRFTLNDSIYRLHHDVSPMPNGNVLMIVWEKKNFAEAVQAGRKPELLPNDEVWSEVILEWSPELDSIVWQWSVWDHLIQNFDDTKDNYGQVHGNYGKIDINYDEHDGHPDWLHINAIDYNPVMDQIALSVPYFNEVWIIDHNTTTEEARTAAKGDLLYRWGNPKTYIKDMELTKQLFFEHDVHWLNPLARPGDQDFGQILLFNNRYTDEYSVGTLFSTPVDSENFSYPLNDQLWFAPDTALQTVRHPDEQSSRDQSDGLSSIQLLDNGNWFILYGRWGYAVEFTSEGEIVWEYVIPLKAGLPVEQGTVLSSNNNLAFRMTRYSSDYAAFEGKNLGAGLPLENNPNNIFCNPTSVSDKKIARQQSFEVYPNPTIGSFAVRLKGEEQLNFIRLYGIGGTLIRQWQNIREQNNFNISGLEAGFYLIETNLGTKPLIVKQ